MNALTSTLTELECRWRMDAVLAGATRRRAGRLARRLRDEPQLCIKRTLVGGSFAKEVETCLTDDLDLYVYIDFSGAPWGGLDCRRPDEVLDRLNALLEEVLWASLHRGRVTLRAQQHSVGLRYRDDGALSYDIVPLAHRPRTPAWVELPRRQSGGWVKTSVRRQLQLIREAASRYPGLRGAVRLLKVWKQALPPSVEGSRWSAYALEVIAIWVCRGLPGASSPGEIFVEVLRWLEATRLREVIDLKRWPTPRPAMVTQYAIWDPAHALNELTPVGASSARRLLWSSAADTLRALVSTPPSVDACASVIAPTRSRFGASLRSA